MDKKATTLMMRLFNILLIGILLAGFLLIMAFGSLKESENQEIIKINEKLTYSEDNLQMINYLRSNFQFPKFGNSSVLSILINYDSNLLSSSDVNFLKEQTENILNNMTYCQIIDNKEILRSYSFYLTAELYMKFDEIEEIVQFSSESFCNVDDQFICNDQFIVETQKLLDGYYLILVASDTFYSGENCLKW